MRSKTLFLFALLHGNPNAYSVRAGEPLSIAAPYDGGSGRRVAAPYNLRQQML